jgi:N-acetylglucosaminyldiphosphoundecaprenol N-acetyl-beta-D-mannosaminyltransferase
LDILEVSSRGEALSVKPDLIAGGCLPPTLSRATSPERVPIWGIPIAPLTVAETVAALVELIRVGRPNLIITANTQYAMHSHRDANLRAVNAIATLILADGMPVVWASRLGRTRLPERVPGSTLLFHLAAEGAARGYRIALLGGAEGVAEEAARRLCSIYPGLQVVETICPPFGAWSPEQEAAMIARVRAARPDILVTALTMPRAEFWLAANREALGVPVMYNGGASIDFAAGRIRRAPRWLQDLGLEWAYRLFLEPTRLGRRYAENAWFITFMTARGLLGSTREEAVVSHGPHGTGG